MLRAQGIRYPADAGLIDVTQAPYNADKTGATDAAAAIQQALLDYGSTTRTLCFPNGTYKISKPLAFNYAWLSLQGESRDGVILRLPDATPDFDDKTKPKAVLSTFLAGYTNETS